MFGRHCCTMLILLAILISCVLNLGWSPEDATWWTYKMQLEWPNYHFTPPASIFLPCFFFSSTDLVFHCFRPFVCRQKASAGQLTTVPAIISGEPCRQWPHRSPKIVGQSGRLAHNRRPCTTTISAAGSPSTVVQILLVSIQILHRRPEWVVQILHRRRPWPQLSSGPLPSISLLFSGR